MEASDVHFDEPPREGSEDPALPPSGAHEASSVGAGIRGARDRNERRLLATPGVVGVAIGRTPLGDDAIVVYLRDASYEQAVPREVEGYPVQTIVTGEIEALGAS